MGRGNAPLLALTMGDPAGIGPELCLRVLAAPPEGVRLALFGDWAVLALVAAKTGLWLPDGLQPRTPQQWAQTPPTGSLDVVDCAAVSTRAVVPGTISAACGAAAAAYVKSAVEATIAGRADAVVTAPINKESLRAAGVPFPGHTEMLAALTGATSCCMMLTAPALTVSFATTHRSLASVPGALSVERVTEVIRLTADAVTRLGLGAAEAMGERVRRRPPRIGVCGLNPHAGEHGLFGDEEGRIIGPAIAIARDAGLDVSDPLAPDSSFVEHVRSRYDAIVCMYHDQGHIPFKMLAFEEGVNVTLGLPIVRTSVDHGTAFDIAWQGRASPGSFLAAIGVAARLVTGGGG